MRFIDSHTGGQPTRVVISGGPDLGTGPLSERRALFAEKFDHFRRKSILEPKCSDAMVGALLCQPTEPKCSAGVIFFNNAGFLGMCGHGTIGLLATLGHLGLIKPGRHLIETPVGIVKTELLSANKSKIENVESYCLHRDVTIDVPSLGPISGDVAWGGNWFFLAKETPCALIPANITELTNAAWLVRRALVRAGITGDDGAEIDHIEFFQASPDATIDSRNFVLCPGGAYDRSPCGTGTSAKLACLAEAGLVKPGQNWLQQSIIGSQFNATFEYGENGRIIPTITGEAYIYSKTELISQPGDPFEYGIEK